MNKNIKLFKHTRIKTQSGEIREESAVQTYTLKNEEDYIKIYIKHINYIRDLPQGMEGVIYELMKCMNYGNKIVINSHIKRTIAGNTKKTFNTINQYITKLVDNKVLLREARGVYYLNPLFYGKGKWKDILELRAKLELKIEYSNDQYTILTKL